MNNISLLVIDDEVGYVYKILSEKLPAGIFKIDFCNAKSNFIEAYNDKDYQIVVINSTNCIKESLKFICAIKNNETKIIIIGNTTEDAFNFYKFNIVDFILFPMRFEELLIAILKSISKIIKINLTTKLEPNVYKKFITVASLKKIEVIKVCDINYFEAHGRYTLIFLKNGKQILATKNLGDFQKKLDPKIFCRVHHKFIINLDRLIYINKSEGCYCLMENEKIIPISKRKMEDLNLILNTG